MVTLGLDYGSPDNPKPPDWTAAKQAGVSFVILRGCYGTFVDPLVKRDYEGIAAAGLVRSLYLFLRFPKLGGPAVASPDTQAHALLDVIKTHPRGKHDMPPCLDIEFPGNGRRDTGLTAKQALEWARTAWQTLKDGCGVAPLIYTSARVWKEDLDDLSAMDLTDSPLWLARCPFRTGINAVMDRVVIDHLVWPPVPPSWGTDNVWIHQWQGDARNFPGISSTVDLNRFRYMVKGEKGARVAWVQRRLGRKATGVFDADLDKVIRTLQRMTGLESDGVIGPQTFAQLCWCDGVEKP